MRTQYQLTLLESTIDEQGGTLAFAAPLDRVCFTAEGDATLTDARLVQRIEKGHGAYAHGRLNIKAETGPTRLWIWELTRAGATSPRPAHTEVKLTQILDIDGGEKVMRLDRVEFPPGAAAHLHIHPGPGIRIVEKGRIGIRQGDAEMKWMGPGEPWFERGPDPVFAPTTEDTSTIFIRCLVLPIEWRGLNTIRYVDPADAEKPKLQRYYRFVDALIDLPLTTGAA